jgi:hypothetical protein
MEKVFIIFLIETDMKEISKIIKFKEMKFNIIKMETDIKEVIKIIKD